MDDFYSDLPKEDPQLPAAYHAEGGSIEIRTANSNLGAVRVAVPRNLGGVMQRIDQLAQVFGDKWEYGIPFKNRRTGKTEMVTGATVGCALAIANAYGNCTVDVEKIEEVGDSWIFHAVFLDIETGFRLGRPFRQRRALNAGGYGGDADRAMDVAFQIGASKAMRNVVVNALKSVVEEALDRAQNRIVAYIERNREKANAKFVRLLDELGIEMIRVERYFSRTFADLKPVHLAQAIKIIQAVGDKMIDAAEAFSPETSTKGEPMREGSPDQLRVADPADQGPAPKAEPRRNVRAAAPVTAATAPDLPTDDEPTPQPRREPPARREPAPQHPQSADDDSLFGDQ